MTKNKKQSGFTLPEVIVSFSVLVMVITAATQILVTVLSVNADNSNSLVAYGLAQEGIEAMRFVRDTNTILGLQYDGATKGKPDESVWGQKLFDATALGAKFFTLEVKKPTCLKTTKSSEFTSDCVPVQLMPMAVTDPELLKTALETLVYKKDGGVKSDLVYVQSKTASGDTTLTASQFHRFIRVEPLKSDSKLKDADKLLISSVVSWPGNADSPMQVVLTTELTNWK